MFVKKLRIFSETFNVYKYFERKFNFLKTLITIEFNVFRRLLGVITKKDVLRHVKQMDNEDPNTVLFN